MVRSLAAYDYDRALIIARWPLREVLLAYVELLREQARDRYQTAVNHYVIMLPNLKKGTAAPRLPKLLEDTDVDA